MYWFIKIPLNFFLISVEIIYVYCYFVTCCGNIRLLFNYIMGFN